MSRSIEREKNYFDDTGALGVGATEALGVEDDDSSHELQLCL